MQTNQTTALEAYRHRTEQTLPQAFAEGAPAPPTWTGTQDEWAALTAEVRRSHDLRPVHDFATAIAMLGYFPDELATGTLRPGATVAVMSGRVQRPLAPEITTELAEACREVLTEAVRLNVTFDGVIAQALEFAAWYRRGSEKDVRNKLRVAEAAVNERRAVLEAKRQNEAAMPVLIVHRPFRAKRGRSYSPGRFKVSADEVAELEDWRATMEAQAAEHGWDAPNGYTTENWPPFSVGDAYQST